MLTAQDLPLQGRFTTLPFKNVPAGEVSTSAQVTIPYFGITLTAPKDGKDYTAYLAGGPPVGGTTTTNVVVIPVRFRIATNLYDPLTANPCDSFFSPQARFDASPLVVSRPRNNFNGVDVGASQYVDGFRRAEFWNSPFANAQATKNFLSFSYAPEWVIGPETVSSHGFSISSGCNQLGVVSIDWLDNYLFTTVIPTLTTRGVISPSKFALFLFSNVVQSDVDPPVVAGHCCILGYHTAFGNSSFVQTYGTTMWNTTLQFGSALQDAHIAGHEIAEWFDDPFVNNSAPDWGNVGQEGGCTTDLEVADALTGTSVLIPPLAGAGGSVYHMPELTFFSWFFNARTTPSWGTGGLFSSNGTFKGPSKVCPPGGTF